MSTLIFTVWPSDRRVWYDINDYTP